MPVPIPDSATRSSSPADPGELGHHRGEQRLRGGHPPTHFFWCCFFYFYFFFFFFHLNLTWQELVVPRIQF